VRARTVATAEDGRAARETCALVVSEIFGPTLQGEGPSVGQRCSFVRLGGCNLHCAWCDTAYTWDWTGRNGHRYDPRSELRTLPIDDVWSQLEGTKTQMVVVSGGEPLLQQDALTRLLTRARAAGWRVELETAGTIMPTAALCALVTQFNVSPKLAHSGNDRAARYRPEVLDRLQATQHAVWKFVAQEPADLEEIAELVAAHQLRPVYVMPEGTSADALLRRSADLADAVIARGWNLTTRLHILLYGARRGV
jgi:7-carboxy-7-deazaguanine synthase